MEDFHQGVALCQAVPGATAMQCAAYVGLRVRGLRGAVLAYVGFGLPAFLLMLSLSIAYRYAVPLQPMTSILAGLRALVVALVANATWVFGRSSVKSFHEAMICLATAALFFLGGSPFLILVAAGLGGSLLLRGPVRTPSRESPPQAIGWAAASPGGSGPRAGRGARRHAFLLNQQLVRLGLVMMKVDVFAFGGGFASVPLMFREIVDVRNWLPADVLMDGIALGQLTPGPIVITATFVGYQVAGLAGAIVGTVCIFLPSFFAVVLVEPWWEQPSLVIPVSGRNASPRALLRRTTRIGDGSVRPLDAVERTVRSSRSPGLDSVAVQGRRPMGRAGWCRDVGSYRGATRSPGTGAVIAV